MALPGGVAIFNSLPWVRKDVFSIPVGDGERVPGQSDAEGDLRYQTVFADVAGAIAAPTAGLHFTKEILSQLPHVFVTLHVGTGTFRPVQSERLTEHRMHAERFSISEKAAGAINRAQRIVAVGTTTVRALEAAAVARAAGIICNVNGSVETGVGNLANLQLAAAAPAVVLSCVVPVSTPAEAQSGQIAGIYYKDDLIAEPMRFVDGAIELPPGPGMGIAVDESKVRRYCVDDGRTG